MKFEDYTKNQQTAIIADGGVLVTASAGSGKTSVLVERVMNKILQKGTPIDRLLIVTFTNAAAAEMRERIEKSLAKAQRENPKSSLIAKQKQRLAAAKICTVDSFCIELVRENFDALGVMPDFAVCDLSNLENMQNQALDEIFEPLYEQDCAEFRALLQATGDSYGDDKIKNYVKKIYSYATNMPFYADWLKQWREYYDRQTEFEGSVWDKTLTCEIEQEFLRLEKIIGDALFVSQIEEPDFESYKNSLIELKGEIEVLRKCCADSKKLLKAVENRKVFTFDQKRSAPALALANAVKEYNAVVEQILQWYDCQLGERYEFTASVTKMLIDIVLQFDERFNDLMCQNNSLTFARTEQLALQLLCENTSKGIVATKRGVEIANDYDEIIVDEYQDTNDLQDALMQILSGDGERLFVVGDAKQSIYEFRGTNPVNFINKAEDGRLKKIELLDNFRSKGGVCEFINKVFCDLMTMQNSKIEYKEQMLKANDKSGDRAVFLNFYSTKGISQDQAVKNEAALIAEYIKSVMEQEPNKYKYSDFTILKRGNKRMGIYADVLKKHGIPAYCSREDFTNRREVGLCLALLSVVDNPTRDEHLLAVMLSPLFCFDADSLALLRHDYPAPSIWASVLCAAQNGDRACCNLCERIREYRRLLLVNKLSDVLDLLIDMTGLEDIVRALPGGAERIKNLRTLQTMAQEYEKNGTKDVPKFVESVMQGGLSQKTAPDSVDAVKIGTMHSSKGLEYPVCIIADASDSFMSKGEVGFSIKNTLGIACDAVGQKLSHKIKSPARAAIDLKNRNDNVAEELRLMYVFMTRAKERLAIFAGYSDLGAKLKEVRKTVKNNGGRPDAKRTPSYMNCILQSVAANNPTAIERLENIIGGGTEVIENVEYTFHTDIPSVQCQETIAETVFDEVEIKKAVEQIEKNISYKYPFEQQTVTPSKISVSELTHNENDKEYSFTRKPAFMSKKQLTPAQRGTATHLFMQFCDMQKAHDNAKQELERLVEYQFITEQQANAVDLSAINAFFTSPLYERACKADKLYREIRFLTKVYPNRDQTDEPSVLQGVADCVFVENNNLVILDFKTDRVSDEQTLIQRYERQLQLYSNACQKTFGMPVKECIIYSFVLKKSIKL